MSSLDRALRRLGTKFERLPREMTAAAVKAQEAAAERIVRRQKSLAPKDRGNLVDAIMWETEPGTVSTRVFVNYSKTNGKPRAPHGHLVEFGAAPHVIESEKPMGVQGKFGHRVEHPGAPAQPFFYPGYRAERSESKREIRKALQEAAQKVARG